MDEFIQRLKSATGQLHQDLEASGLTAAIMSDAVSEKSYFSYLQASNIMHSEVEKHVYPALATIIANIDSRKKTTAINSDLKNMPDSLHTASAIKAEGRFLDKDYRNNTEFNLGIMYVTEGSTLGGLYILKHLEKTTHTVMPAAFLSIYGQKTGPMWRDFLEQMGVHVNGLDETAKNEIIDGAVYAFQRAYAIFNP